jgi:hypothetical protein
MGQLPILFSWRLELVDDVRVERVGRDDAFHDE